MTLREKLQKIAEFYDLFPDLTENEKMENHIFVLAEKYGIALSPIVRCGKCTHWSGNETDNVGSCDCDALIRNRNFYCAAGDRRRDDG